jgi:putative transposase
MRKPPFVNGDIYHIFNRGVEKRIIFTDDSDYLRFVHSLYEFNDEGAVSNFSYYFNPKTMEVQARNPRFPTLRVKRKPLVELLVFTLMPNHYHLMLRQITDDGIVKFMQKIGTGYTNYFNNKYERVGPLFQGRFRAAPVKKESHFIHLPHYIHTNPLKLADSESNPLQFLISYRWSSFPDYIGHKNFPSVTKREFLLEVFGGENAYKQYTIERLNEGATPPDNDLINIILE